MYLFVQSSEPSRFTLEKDDQLAYLPRIRLQSSMNWKPLQIEEKKGGILKSMDRCQDVWCLIFK